MPESAPSTLGVSCFLDALHGTNQTGRPPIWMMRQAGRYLPEYRAIRDEAERKHNGFLTMIQTPELATEVTLQPLRRFGMDAAILFSDILVTASALGCPVRFVEKQGPVFDTPIRSPEALAALRPASEAVADLDYVMAAIRMLKGVLTVPLIGFAGAPFTVASYMIEGQSSSSLSRIKRMQYEQPAVLHGLLSQLTEVTIAYLKQQVDAGVDALQLFDTWTNHLSVYDAQQLCFPYIQTIITAMKAYTSIPIIVFCKNTGVLWPDVLATGPTAISLDWGCDAATMRACIPDTIAVQGNIDPFLLYANPQVIEQRVKTVLNDLGDLPNYIVNLGHGIMPDIPVSHVQTVVDTVKAWGS